eukprot:6453181-Ditylum_brightwellii.AAC.1
MCQGCQHMHGENARNSGHRNIQKEKLLAMQLNWGSILADLQEFRSRLELVQPDIVLVQETRLQPTIVPKFHGYYAQSDMIE